LPGITGERGDVTRRGKRGRPMKYLPGEDGKRLSSLSKLNLVKIQRRPQLHAKTLEGKGG